MTDTRHTPRVFRYSVPSEKYEGWAILFLDDQGCFAVLSDYGDYAYRWHVKYGLAGRDLRTFLLECDDHYLLSKLNPQMEYDGEKTAKGIREYIEQCKDDWTPERYEDEIDLLSDLESDTDFAHWMHNTTISDAWEMARRSHSAQAVAFLSRAWPRLKRLIADELDAEAKARGVAP